MSAEKTALITTYDGRGLSPIAKALAENYRIVSLGSTAKNIDDDINVISVEEFLGIPPVTSGISTSTPAEGQELRGTADDRKLFGTADDRELRGAFADLLIPRIRLPYGRLAKMGREAIHLVYISLMPPEAQFDGLGRYAGVMSDEGGIRMIKAATEGERHVFTNPQQIADFLDVSKWEGGTPDGPAELKDQALNDLRLYDEHAQQLGEMTLRSLAAA